MHRCASPEDIQAYVLGKLAAPRWREVELLIDQCERCQAAVAELDSSDSFEAALRSAVKTDNRDPCEAELECGWAVSQAAALASPKARGEDRSPSEHVGVYRILDRLGAGGMGTVYKAEHTKLKRIVALKLLSSRCTPTPLQVLRFEREMEAVGQLDHPHIVRASDAGEADGVHYLVMEYVDGVDLSELVRRLGRLSVADACEATRQAALALQYVHDSALVHRDVKPSNLMLTRDGEIKLLDLGLALLDQKHANYNPELTTVDQLMGTLDYMSPEQGVDSHDVDIRSDIYSLGATLYKLLCGAAPFDTHEWNTPLKKIRALATSDAPPITHRREDIPHDLAAIVTRMAARDPQARYASPSEVAEALQEFCSGSDLSSLAQQAIRLRDAESLPRGDRCLGEPESGRRASSAMDKPAARGRSRGLRWPLGAAALFSAVLAGLVIYLKTSVGDLVIHCDDPGVEVSIRSGGEAVRQWRLEKGENATTLYAGEYEVVLKAASDALHVQNGSFSLSRGGQAVVRIERRRDTAAASPSAGERQPTYSGRTLDQWLEDLNYERNPEKVLEALQAIDELADDAKPSILAEAILRTMRRYQSWSWGGDPDGRLVEFALNLFQRLYRERFKELQNLLLRELREGNVNSRLFLVQILSGVGGDIGFKKCPSGAELQPYFSETLALMDDQDPLIRSRATSLAWSIDPDSATLLDKTREAARREQEVLPLSAVTRLLIKRAKRSPEGYIVAEESDQLLDALRRLLRAGSQQEHWQLGGYDFLYGVTNLRNFPPDVAAKAAPELGDLLRFANQWDGPERKVVHECLVFLGELGSRARDAAPAIRQVIASWTGQSASKAEEPASSKDTVSFPTWSLGGNTSEVEAAQATLKSILDQPPKK